METTKKVLIALGTGIALGGVLGILFAPHKGRKTRQKISEESKHIADRLKDVLDDTMGKRRGDLQQEAAGKA